MKFAKRYGKMSRVTVAAVDLFSVHKVGLWF
jgi:hypothetical protein